MRRVSTGRHRGSDLRERQVAEKQLWSGSCVRLLLLTCQSEQACSQGFSVEVKPPRSQKSSAETSLTCFGHAQTTLGGRSCGSAHKRTLTFSEFQQISRSRAAPPPHRYFKKASMCAPCPGPACWWGCGNKVTPATAGRGDK